MQNALNPMQERSIRLPDKREVKSVVATKNLNGEDVF
jgi:hypothetical protein